jgi:ATPase
VEKYVADISVILDGSLKEAVISGNIRWTLFILEEAVDYLERLARQDDGVGLVGVAELKDLKNAVEKLGLSELVHVEYVQAGAAR